MRILIIGVNGFIGSHIHAYYRNRPDLEIYSCSQSPNLRGLKNYFCIDAFQDDYLDVFKHYLFDVCINCSGSSNVQQSWRQPLTDFTLNVANVCKILDSIRQSQPKCKFINLSSAAVYGNPKKLPINEMDTTHPISPYGIHKLQAEQICEEYFTHFGIPTCSLRIFSAYGEGLEKQILWDVFQKFKVSDCIELFGTGKETRDFIHIDDIIQAVDCCLLNSRFEAETINVANGIEHSINNIAILFASFYPNKKNIIFNNQVKKGDPLRWCADIDCLKSLGYQQKVEISVGLKRYYDWVLKNEK